MKTLIKKIGKSAAFIALLLLSVNAISQIPVEDFFRSPEKTEFRISPDGKYVSFLAPFEGKSCLFVQDLATNAVSRITKDVNVSKCYWANEKRIIYLADKNGDENFSLFAIDANGKKNKALNDAPGINNIVIDPIRNHPFEVIIATNKRDAGVMDPYRMNIETGEMSMIAQNSGKIDKWFTDHDGNLRLATETDGVTTTILIRPNEASPFKALVVNNFKDAVSPIGFTFDNKNIYVISNKGKDKTALVVMDGNTGKEIQSIYENLYYDIDHVYFSEKMKTITSISYNSWKKERNFMDKEVQKSYQKLAYELKTEELSVIDMNYEEDKILLRSSSDKSLGAVYLFDALSGTTTKLYDNSPWIKEDQMAEMKPINFTSRDGLSINGYLTLPKNVDTVNLPIVVIPHGGLNERDVWGYNGFVQFLASRGYGVLQINYRGSKGYGKSFLQAGYKQFGLNIQNDINDGVNYLVNRGIADKSRVAIYGESFGGNIALCGVACTPPDVFACAVLHSGITDMYSYISSIPPYWKAYKKMMTEIIGNPATDSTSLNAASPILKDQNVKVPVFIAHGARDMMAKKQITDKLVADLKANNVEVTYLVKPNEGHIFKNEQNIFELYKAIEVFLAKNLAKK